jgi:hypothetical protein
MRGSQVKICYLRYFSLGDSNWCYTDTEPNSPFGMRLNCAASIRIGRARAAIDEGPTAEPDAQHEFQGSHEVEHHSPESVAPRWKEAKKGN